MIELDHLQIDLKGANLIEASAGTGKTHAIACLYLRLLIETGLTPDQILVVTFTEAATKELHGRIRDRIRRAVQAMDGSPADDAFLKSMVENVNGKGPGRLQALERLDRALNAFDTASIFTIHGFCRRALMENAFESGSLYDTELVTGQEERLREIVDDFWRMHFFKEAAPLLDHALNLKYTPDSLTRFVGGLISSPNTKVIPEFKPDQIAAIEEKCRTAFESLRNLWSAHKDEIRNILVTDKSLKRAADSYRADLLPDLFKRMEAYAGSGNPFSIFPDFNKFGTSELSDKIKKNGRPPAHPFFDLCDDIRAGTTERFTALKWELFQFCRKRLPIVKKRQNIRFFDDLLNDLYQALNAENGAALAATLREKYRAALIDEFQDTDPVQYEIFRKIYARTDCPLFLIGDPKQAIYSFRGADIFAYREAVRDMHPDNRFTLTRNWRSSPGLLDAYNTIFGLPRNPATPFVYEWIAYHPVRTGREDGEALPESSPLDASPFRIWVVPPEKTDPPANTTRANEMIPAAVAGEIARLLRQGSDGRLIIDRRPLFPGDIAVIVSTHVQAGWVQDALRKTGIPSVLQSDQSVFTTDEAKDVHTLLLALSDPGRETRVRAALITDLLGRTGDDIARLLEDETAWETCLMKFRRHHMTWLEKGFMPMAHSLLADEGIRGRLLCHPDGERRLTNVLHCFEIIHRKAHEEQMGIQRLVTWFGERICDEEHSEEYQMRLETDEKAVKIVTIHVSKGLEYPIVFCPFLWSGLRETGEILSFHEDVLAVKDFGSPDHAAHRTAAQTESLAESLRLFYVAVTRAKYRCYLVAGKITNARKKENSPPAYLFHSSAETRKSPDPAGRLGDEVKGLSVEDVYEKLHAVRQNSPMAISVAPIPAPDSLQGIVPLPNDGKSFTCRKFTGTIRRDWHVASFTAFASHEPKAMEIPDRDELPSEHQSAGFPDAAGLDQYSIFNFPRGAQAGIFFHEIFENLDFARPSSDSIRSLVESGLMKFGFSQEWRPFVCKAVQNVVRTELATTDGAFALRHLKDRSWICELEFFFPLRFITSDRLGDCLKHWEGRDPAADMTRISAALNFKPVRGMVRGFMDMVFEHGGKYYLVDWKSNHLGYRTEDYGPDGLKAAMETNLYPLQYLLYTVALNRHLQRCVPGYNYREHFGGAIYVFLRGASPEMGETYGFFRDLPPLEMIDSLTRLLIRNGG